MCTRQRQEQKYVFRMEAKIRRDGRKGEREGGRKGWMEGSEKEEMK